ncbi:protein-glutamate methylesterase/protein-glutamine glutaminase [Alteribacter aurantiacus]|uniref:protein-glutamate methylesterase/protein-glutamine glutaminase n=1 Tax=Alteribacter aurantiacus TaxID=254410 RepID=UPI00041DD34E|nr:chemotaxis response regulator protein-glutamate methylesterase [Alteribacter aurantiacus]
MTIDKKIRVVIIDDSAFMRKMIGDLLEADSTITVIGKARNGKQGIALVKELNPDVITLDVEMPVMSGLEALKTLMIENPVPVIMVSSTTKRGADTTMEAMSLGAFDFIPKPSGSISLDMHRVQADLIQKVRAASTSIQSQAVELVNHHKVEEETTTACAKTMNQIVAIGTSTGGPRALQNILKDLPSTFPYPVLIVQHMPPGFTKSLSERLNQLSKIKVKEAENGEIIKRGIAYIAPGGYHLKVKRIGSSVVVQLDYSASSVNGHRPSVDVMLHSLSNLSKTRTIVVILTGMGSDGTCGVKQLKSVGNAFVIAESKHTSIVYGMPRSVIDAGLCDKVVDLNQVTKELLKH